MLDATVVEEVLRLLRKLEVSQREIARRLRISRGTVAAIAKGRSPDYTTRGRSDDGKGVPREQPVGRCPGCGGLVRMPCLACRIRAIWENDKVPNREDPRDRSGPRAR